MESTWQAERLLSEPTLTEYPRGDRKKRIPPKRLAELEPAEQRNRPLAGVRTVLDGLLDKPCPIHSVLLNTSPSHSLRACWVVRQVAKSGEAILEALPPNKRSTSPQEYNAEVLTIYETFPSRNRRKRALRELKQVYHVAVTSAWADIPITFGDTDRPTIRPDHTPAALVLNPIVDGFRLHKVLMDGGSGLNLIYKDTLEKMQFD